MSRLFPPAGPVLPPFRTILIQGQYHASAPIHLCLSSITPETSAIIISPSREAFVRSLQGYNDEWINNHSGHGSISSISANIRMFYPPTPAHLVALLSSFRVHDSHEDVPLDLRATLDTTPTLLVLHEPSLYFSTRNIDSPHTISSYLLLVTHALAALSFLSTKQTCAHNASFALFDSRLDRLKLPILRLPPRSLFSDEEDTSQPPEPKMVTFFAQKYFEWVGTFEKDANLVHTPAPLEGLGETRETCRLRLHKCNSDDDSDITWKWFEITQQPQDSTEKSKAFVW